MSRPRVDLKSKAGTSTIAANFWNVNYCGKLRNALKNEHDEKAKRVYSVYMEEEDRWELLDTKDKKRKARRPTFVTDEEEAEIARSAAVLHASLRRANIDPDQVAARGGGRGLLIETEVARLLVLEPSSQQSRALFATVEKAMQLLKARIEELENEVKMLRQEAKNKGEVHDTSRCGPGGPAKKTAGRAGGLKMPVRKMRVRFVPHLQEIAYLASASNDPNFIPGIIRMPISDKPLSETTLAPSPAKKVPMIRISMRDAVVAQDAEGVRAALLRGADANQRICDHGRSILQIAVEKANIDIIIQLVGAHADPNLACNQGIVPLLTASQEGELPVVRLLLRAAAEVSAADVKGTTPLLAASRAGHSEVVRELLLSGAAVNLANTDGETPLLIASFHGYTAVVCELLGGGKVDVDQADVNGTTPLLAASRAGHSEVVRELLLSGAAVNLADTDGETPLCAASEGGHSKVVQELLGASASVDQADVNGTTPLLAASRAGHSEVVRELLLSGAAVNLARANTNDGDMYVYDTPLLTASFHGYTAVVRELLGSGEVDVNHAITGCNATALHFASLQGHSEVVRLLLRAGAAINQNDADSCTPLLYASRRGHLEIVRALLLEGADASQTDNEEVTPLMAARAGGHSEVVRALMEGAADRPLRSSKRGRACRA